ncbi:MAG: CvpA family protein [Coprococcus sp.]|nr:CvpA family protein [Coprococcus sp.]
MNWLLIGIIGIICIGAVVGFFKGAIRIAVSLAATLLTLAVVFFAAPFVSKAIYSLTPVDEMIEKECTKMISRAFTGADKKTGLTEDQVRRMLDGAGVSEEELAAGGVTVEDIVNGKVSGKDLTKFGISSGVISGHVSQDKPDQSLLDSEIPRQVQIAAIESADIPDVFKELLLTNNNSEMYKALGVTTFVEYISTYAAKIIINILSFLGTFLIVTIVLRAVVFALDFVTELPLLGTLNRLAGAGVGIIIALIVIGFLFVGITLLYMTSFGEMMMEMIAQNKFLTFLYEHNYIMKIMTAFR